MGSSLSSVTAVPHSVAVGTNSFDGALYSGADGSSIRGLLFAADAELQVAELSGREARGAGVVGGGALSIFNLPTDRVTRR